MYKEIINRKGQSKKFRLHPPMYWNLSWKDQWKEFMNGKGHPKDFFIFIFWNQIQLLLILMNCQNTKLPKQPEGSPPSIYNFIINIFCKPSKRMRDRVVIPVAIHLTSSYRCPNRENSIRQLSIAFVTTELSPSITISVNSVSTANSSAFYMRGVWPQYLHLMVL